ncbi:hypothetical protein ABZY90_19505 [Streptomyces sp. NPDC006422]|uniref:hypothetical protein n=1 Tax=unclassified Streptomyces TaxID=2593676 RepID=UPI0033A182CE
MTDYSQRHPGTQHLMQFFTYQHLQGVSFDVCNIAYKMVESLPDGPELTAGLRKLLEAKDCFVRAALARAGTDAS